MEKDFPEEGEIVLCTVEKILGTTVFVKLEDYGKVGIIATSEVSPGRIRNIRDFVTPNKKIVCKALRIDREKAHIDLSLRRVSLKEKKDTLQKYKREKNISVILDRIIADKTKLLKLITEIKKEYPSLFDFFQILGEKPQLLEKYGLNEDEISEVLKLALERAKQKKIEIKAKISLACKYDTTNGINAIKGVFDVDNEKVKITYTSAPHYLVSVESDDYKEANKIMNDALEKISSKIKALGCFSENEIEKVS